MKNYMKTKRACYLGFVTQAIAANFAPLLFLKFHTDYNIPLGDIALISTCFFFSQLVVDLFCAKFVDKIGYRTCIVASEVCSAVGLVGLAFLPELLPSPFAGIIISVIIYAVGSGLIEVLCSPIVEACPFENKEATMSLLHSFYCWGSVGTILISTAFFAIFGIDSWKWLAVLLALVPAYNIYNFATCPIEHLVDEGQGMGIRDLFKTPLFWVAVVLMVCSGASELSMAQWASAYAESALGLSKTFGDLLGPCMFAVAMGISRVLYGKYGDKVDLSKFMLGSGALCVMCYVLASLFENPQVGLVGCILCGFSVGIMWPGTLSISSKKFPAGGTVLFSLLAMSGDLGGSIGPGLVGRVTQMAGDNIRSGMAVGMIFPIVMLIGLIIFGRLKEEEPKRAVFHLPGLFEFYDFYKEFLPVYKSHPEYFYDWCTIGSIYGAPQDCLWAGGRVSVSDASPEEVLKLMQDYGISARLTFSNSLITQEHLSDERCNKLCKMLKKGDGVIVYSELLLNYLRKNYEDLYFVSSTTKVQTNFYEFKAEAMRPEFAYVVPDFRLNKEFERLRELAAEEKEKIEFLCNECCWFNCYDRKNCYENVSRINLGEDCQDHQCVAPEAEQGYSFAKAMENPAFISKEDIVNTYLPMGFSNFKIEGRGLGSALVLEFILYYMVKPEYHIHIREALYLSNTLDLF